MMRGAMTETFFHGTIIPPFDTISIL